METAWAGHCKLKDNGHEVHKHNGIVLIDRKKMEYSGKQMDFLPF